MWPCFQCCGTPLIPMMHVQLLQACQSCWHLFHLIVIPTAPTPPAQVGFSFYLRFSAELNEEASVELVTDSIEIEVVSFCLQYAF